jgi:neutral amino acid transport system ATP-binding protein
MPERPGAAALRDVAPEPGVAKPDPILVADGVRRHFGGLTAVDVDHLELQRGCITSLIGPNGAGKTTFFNLMTGFDRPNEGTWSFDGAPLAGVPAHRVAERGMVRTFQLTKALTRLTVLENMKLGATGQRGERFLTSLWPGTWRSQDAEIEARAEELLVRFKLDHMRDELGGTLSGGQRKLLEMARALMVEPEMVMLDEPMAGVNPALTQSLLGHVKDLPSMGMTVLFVEHDMDVVMDISDWVVVMAQGRIIAEGPPRAVAEDEPSSRPTSARSTATRAASPRSPAEGRPPPRSSGRAPVLTDDPAEDRPVRDEERLRWPNLLVADDVTAGYLPGIDILTGCNLTLDEGEFVGIIGPNGAGKSTLLKSLFGLVEVRKGSVRSAVRTSRGCQPTSWSPWGSGTSRRPRTSSRASPSRRTSRWGCTCAPSSSRSASPTSPTCSRCCPTAASSGPAPCPAASGRWSRWLGR